MLKGFHASGWFLTDVTIICIGFNRQIAGINLQLVYQSFLLVIYYALSHLL